MVLSVFFTATDEHLDEAFGVDHAFVIDVHGVKGVVHFLLGELVTPGKKSVLEPAGKNVFV